MTLKDEHHTRLLMAYVSRLTVSQLERITEAQRNAWHQGMNGSTGAQLDAHNKLEATVKDVISEIIQWDKNVINTVVNKTVRGR